MQRVSAQNFHLHKAKIMSSTLDLPDQFQLVVVGTGLVESIVAAAAARMGHTVLHIDTAGYYGGDFASFTLEGLDVWIKSSDESQENSKQSDSSPGQSEQSPDQSEPSPDQSEQSPDQSEPSPETPDLPELGKGEEYLNLGSFKTVENLRQTWFVETSSLGNEKPTNPDLNLNPSDPETSESLSPKAETSESSLKANPSKESKVWSKETLLKESRRFNIDLTPRLLYARGSMVELLISSNIARYTEFKSVTRVLTQIDGRLEHVPSSRADVFSTKHISVVEKRILMKFLSLCISEKDEDIMKGMEEKPFREFLKHEKLTDNLIHFVLYSIAMVKPDTNTVQGIQQTRKFLSSLGRFGSTPFLWSMYGSGELPQAFCRLCAVYGGVYYLGRALDNIIIKDGKCIGVVAGGKRILCDYLVLPDTLTPDTILPSTLLQVGTRRSMFITETSLLPSEKEQITLLTMQTQEPLHVIEVGPGTATCPKGLQVVHASCKDWGEEIEERVREVLPEKSILYSLSFIQKTRTGDVGTTLENVYRAEGPYPELDFDTSVLSAEQIYARMFPGEEFLPRAPDPEEIIIGEENEGKNDNHDEKVTGENADQPDETADKPEEKKTSIDGTPSSLDNTAEHSDKEESTKTTADG
ncbi:rab proteins geranylgeranyltransferase component A-like [Eurytemora carolleeae]|uniref:rab proteins geranylgeranyltransferase component A-like n=1 Tax=Eurytemora carolleeae TaxID=1294199 RepID=UPI000C75EA8A|nr:rab proteins geranylgeranyltransferase component A-like [Eurytemora carolleeae]XP_023339362.1 rab proteins geranylgeranyltransferase component A-like [Eurytemora carolleeae]|eukprot:XP_023339361.1 rab proteins geranylgeranyltransferase component A-like [Eurytemora affinis]